MSPEEFACLDFEASSLSAQSWPIEIGLSWIQDGRIQTWDTLIKPESYWPMEAWSPVSAAVHGIPLSDLERAPSAAHVAEEFFLLLNGRRLVSDAREFESRWLTRLTETIGHTEVPPIADFDAISHFLFVGHALDVVYETLAQSTAPHRAGADSARLANAWLAASRIEKAGRGT